jgi:hypothetical protein
LAGCFAIEIRRWKGPVIRKWSAIAGLLRPTVMLRINRVVAAILCGATLALALYAWLNRYEYRLVEIAPGVFFETKRDAWTGRTCVARATAREGLPREVPECDDGQPRFLGQ